MHSPQPCYILYNTSARSLNSSPVCFHFSLLALTQLCLIPYLQYVSNQTPMWTHVSLFDLPQQHKMCANFSTNSPCVSSIQSLTSDIICPLFPKDPLHSIGSYFPLLHTVQMKFDGMVLPQLRNQRKGYSVAKFVEF